MDTDRRFLWIICAIYSFYTLLRIKYRKNSHRKEKIIEQYEKQRGILYLNWLIIYEVLTFIIFALWTLFNASTVPFNLVIAETWRWIGVIIGILALLLFYWVHYSLGVNFSPHLEVKQDQVLIQLGPYKWVRHPMYTAFFLLHLAVFVISTNYFLGISWMLGLFSLIMYRIPKEEDMMLKKFGNQYEEYMKKTTRFLPWLL